MAVEQARRNIRHRLGQSVVLVTSVAFGVALAISIITAGAGVEQEVNRLLNIPGLPSQVDLVEIHNVLDQTRNLLRILAYAFTAALVAAVTWISMGRRRYEIAINVMRGRPIRHVVWELLIESLILCVGGGFIGVGLGLLLCKSIQEVIPSLPMNPEVGNVLTVFPISTILSFAATSIVASYFIRNIESDPLSVL